MNFYIVVVVNIYVYIHHQTTDAISSHLITSDIKITNNYKGVIPGTKSSYVWDWSMRVECVCYIVSMRLVCGRKCSNNALLLWSDELQVPVWYLESSVGPTAQL